ncbi:MAG: cytosine deaminase [Epsilonproteobacteria bacterium (ex Lamellibrachia satsuma)]|nr:MAG: cytosine deaminase [Epsilonproteobacteria bacterium (ex Lamellibrachia satsuma)]
MNSFMKTAIDEAKKGIEAGHGGPFGAVIVYNGKIIAQGHNEVVKNNDPTAHAEMIVIRKAAQKLQNFLLKGCTLYVTGEPCPMCFSAIHWAHMDRVVYCNTKADAAAIGFDDAFITEIILGKSPDPILFERHSDDTCKILFLRWFEDPKKVLY